MAITNQRNRGAAQKSGGQTKAKKAAAQMGSKVSDMRDEMSGYVSRGTEQFSHLTEGHEGQAVLVALAAGFGIGLVIGMSLASANHRPQRWSDRVTAEGLGRKLLERVESMIPEAITERFSR